MALGSGLVARLTILQIIDHGFYKALAKGQQSLPAISTGERGDIFFTDKQGTLYTVATTKRLPFVFLTPVEVEDQETTASFLADILSISKKTILETLTRTESLFEILKKQLTQREELAIQAFKLPGVYIQQESIRTYQKRL